MIRLTISDDEGNEDATTFSERTAARDRERVHRYLDAFLDSMLRCHRLRQMREQESREAAGGAG